MPTPNTVPHTFPVAIGDRAYVVDLSKYARSTIEIQREAQDSSDEQGDTSLNPKGLWRRSQTNWWGGAGQSHFDDEDSQRFRFEASQGLDPWTKGQLTLQPAMAVHHASTEVVGHIMSYSSAFGDWLYWTEGYHVWVSSFSAYYPNWRDRQPAPPPTATERGYTVVGTEPIDSLFMGPDAWVYFSRANRGVYQMKHDDAQVQTVLFRACNTDFVAYANGYIFAQDDTAAPAASGNLVTLGPTGTPTVVGRHPAGWRWKKVIGMPNGVYAVASDELNSEVYYVGFNPSTGALLPPVIATPWPSRETVHSLIQSGGIIIFGTSRGIRLATVNGDNSLSYGPVIEAPGLVRTLFVYGEYVWFNWDRAVDGASGTGRMALNRFPDPDQPLVPAYASDQYAAVAGAKVTAVHRHENQLYLYASGSGLWIETLNKVSTATLDVGRIRYSTHENKRLVSLDLRHDALNGTVGGTIIDDAGTATNTTTDSAVPGSLSPGLPLRIPSSVPLVSEPRLRLRFVRSALNTVLAPVLRRLTLRAIPVPERYEQFEVPIILKATVKHADVAHAVDVIAEYDYLKGLEATGTIVDYVEGLEVTRVYVDKVAKLAEGWSDDHSVIEGIVGVRLISADAST